MRKPTNELTKDPVMLKIINELRMQGKTGKDLEKALGLANGAFSKWKYTNIKSYMKYLELIADYLNVTTEYLQDIEEREEKTYDITAAEMRIVEIYRKLDFGERECLLKTIEYFSNSCELRKIKGNKDMY